MKNKNFAVSLLFFFLLSLTIGCGGGGGNDKQYPDPPKKNPVFKATLKAGLSEAEQDFKNFRVKMEEAVWQEFNDTNGLKSINTNDKEISVNTKYLLEINGQIMDGSWLAYEYGSNINDLNGAKLELLVNGQFFQLNTADLTWRKNAGNEFNLAIYFIFDGTKITWEKFKGESPPTDPADKNYLTSIDLDLRSTIPAFTSFMVNIDGNFWKQYTDPARLGTIHEDNITIYQNTRYLLEINGQTADGSWCADGSGSNRNLLHNGSMAITIDGKGYQANITDFSWRSNGYGGGNLAIYFTYNGTQLVWEKYTDPDQPDQGSVKRSTDIAADLSSATAPYVNFIVNINGIFWKQYTDPTRLGVILENNITVYQGTKYLLEINGQTANGIWIADGSGINRTLLAGASISLVIDYRKYQVNTDNMIWRSNQAGGGNMAIYFTYDGKQVVWTSN